MKPSVLLSGAAWSALNAAVAVLFPLALFVLFARLVPPWQIGLVAVALASLEILKALCPQGLYETLVAAEPPRARERAAAAVLLASAVAATVAFGAGVGVAAALSETVAEVWPWLAALGLKILFDVATLQPQAALARRAAFRLLALRSAGANLLAGAVGAALAWKVHPLTGMAAYPVLQSALLFLFTVAGAGALAVPRFERGALSGLRREAGFASAVRIVAALNTYLDQILIAAFVPARAVAGFNLGKRIETALATTGSTFSNVLFQPMFASRPASERPRLLRAGRALLTALCGAPVVVFVVLAEPLVGVVFGERWLWAAPAAALLAVSGLARLYGALYGALLSVSGRNDRLFRYASGSTALGALALVAAGPFGVTAAAGALAIKSLIVALWAARTTAEDAPRPALSLIADSLAPLAATGLVAFAAREAVALIAAVDGLGLLALQLAAVTAVALSGALIAARGPLIEALRARRPAAKEAVPCDA